MSCFNRGVSLRVFRRPHHPLNSFLAMQDFTFKTFCRVAETAGKLLADKKPTTGRCLITGKNVSQTASIALHYLTSGQDTLQRQGIKLHSLTHKPILKSNPSFLLKHVPAPYTKRSKPEVLTGFAIPSEGRGTNSCPDFTFSPGGEDIHNCMYC